MNSEAIEWLEGIAEEERYKYFQPTIFITFFSLKDDHESCPYCWYAAKRDQLVVVE